MIKGNEGVRKQLILTVARANQNTALIRALFFSELPQEPFNVFYKHLYGTAYVALTVDINKLFDKTGTNIERFIKLNKSELKDQEFTKALEAFSQIKNKYKSLIEKIQSKRHNLGAHINFVEVNRMYNSKQDTSEEIVVNEMQDFLTEIISVLKSLSIMDGEDIKMLESRIGPKDAMDLLGLKVSPILLKKMLSG